jgi:hypothetical protein
LLNAGARHIYKTWYLAVHPGGTAKRADIADSNLETETDNLFVCDCSVIPETWGLPPSLTLIALGKRLGKHLLPGCARHRRGPAATGHLPGGSSGRFYQPDRPGCQLVPPAVTLAGSANTGFFGGGPGRPGDMRPQRP